MGFYHQALYGNDIMGQDIEGWHDGLSERFAQFIRPLMPHDAFIG